eukprot:TRINITY_DN2993_c0_g2_i2.p1 TRINITY_DN2993_c0_g2~~TRINITY_DN2993_c0_g2_i2.p1  ORF type:complete len:102 (-),score=7.85 TRINITY_DN2993_c0_g2_i2:175-480(-)
MLVEIMAKRNERWVQAYKEPKDYLDAKTAALREQVSNMADDFGKNYELLIAGYPDSNAREASLSVARNMIQMKKSLVDLMYPESTKLFGVLLYCETYVPIQ